MSKTITEEAISALNDAIKEDKRIGLPATVLISHIEAVRDLLSRSLAVSTMSTPTDDLDAKAQRFFMAWPNGDIPAMMAAFARSLAYPPYQ